MKRTVILGAFFSILCLFAANLLAVQVTLLGPKQYVRTDGLPNIYTDSFPGRSGQGKIIVTNGGVDGTVAISSAIIKINGIQIFGPSDFNQNVRLLERMVSLQDENTISVELRSKPGSFLSIQIAQEIAGEAGGVIGAAGGCVEVTNSTSPLYGLKIDIPAGALDKEVLISVEEATNLPPAPSYVKLLSTSFNLLPDGLTFNPDCAVEASVPYAFSIFEPDDFIFVMQYDGLISEWRDVGQTWIDKGANRLGIQIPHFCPYQVMKSAVDLRSSVDIGFVQDTDRFPLALQGPYCKGEAGYTNWYWRKYGSGLRCAYSQPIAQNIQVQSQSALSPYYWWIGFGEDEESVANKLWSGLVIEGKPQLLVLKSSFFSTFAHTVVVYKYEYDAAINRGSFYVFDPDNISVAKLLTYSVDSKDLLDFTLNSGTYKLFQFKQWDPSTDKFLQNVYNQNPIDQVPCPVLPTWTPKFPTQKPSPRNMDAMAYDMANNEVLLFGGYNSPYVLFDDTWAWRGNDWTPITPAHNPSKRYAHAMVYDATRREVVLFGGALTNFGPIGNETWVWNGNDWVAKNPGPGGRYCHAMAYDAARRLVVLFGGNENGDWTNGYRDETWVWDGYNWTIKNPVHKPSPRVTHAIVYDAAQRQVVLFGGADSFEGTGLKNDTWVWDGNDWTLKTPAHSPSARGGHGMVYDAVLKRVILFGGFDGTYSNETWSWDGNDWSLLSPGAKPSPRASCAMAYDMARGQVVLFAGDDGLARRDDTWVWR
jgi:hypothetical protein